MGEQPPEPIELIDDIQGTMLSERFAATGMMIGGIVGGVGGIFGGPYAEILFRWGFGTTFGMLFWMFITIPWHDYDD